MTRVAFVAGATGFTGKALVRALVSAGVQTVAHVREDSPKRDSWQVFFDEIGAEVDATPWVQRAMNERLAELRPAAVFGCLGTTKKRIAKDASHGIPSSYQTVDYGLTVMLHGAAEQCGSDPRFVFVSSAGSKPGGKGSYLGARYAVEQVLIQSDLPYTIARPCFITGPNRDDYRPLEHLGSQITDGILSVIGALGAKSIQARYRSTTDHILGTALSRIAFDPTAANQIIESDGLR